MKCLMLGIMLLSASAMAGDKGNGGNVIVCKDPTGSVRSAEVLDLYEGRVLYGYFYSESRIPHLIQSRRYAEELTKIIGIEWPFHRNIYSALEGIIKNLKFLPRGTGLKPIDDSNEIVVPKGCEVVQTINYLNDENIYVDSDVWMLLSDTQKTALLLHEAVYSFLRNSFPSLPRVEVNSIRTRKVVAMIISGEKLEPIDDLLNQNTRWGSIGCYAPGTIFNIYLTHDHHARFQFLAINGRVMTSRTIVTSRETYPAGLEGISKHVLYGHTIDASRSDTDLTIEVFVNFKNTAGRILTFKLNGVSGHVEKFQCSCNEGDCGDIAQAGEKI